MSLITRVHLDEQDRRVIRLTIAKPDGEEEPELKDSLLSQFIETMDTDGGEYMVLRFVSDTDKRRVIDIVPIAPKDLPYHLGQIKGYLDKRQQRIEESNKG